MEVWKLNKDTDVPRAPRKRDMFYCTAETTLSLVIVLILVASTVTYGVSGVNCHE